MCRTYGRRAADTGRLLGVCSHVSYYVPAERDNTLPYSAAKERISDSDHIEYHSGAGPRSIVVRVSKDSDSLNLSRIRKSINIG